MILRPTSACILLPRPIISIVTPGMRGFFYDVSADGKRYLTIQANESATEEPLVLIQNWPTELRK